MWYKNCYYFLHNLMELRENVYTALEPITFWKYSVDQAEIDLRRRSFQEVGVEVSVSAGLSKISLDENNSCFSSSWHIPNYLFLNSLPKNYNQTTTYFFVISKHNDFCSEWLSYYYVPTKQITLIKYISSIKIIH